MSGPAEQAAELKKLIDGAQQREEKAKPNGYCDLDANGKIPAGRMPGGGGGDHERQHLITDPLDHTSTATAGKLLKANENGLPVDSSSTEAQVAAAVAHYGQAAPHAGHETPAGAQGKVDTHEALTTGVHGVGGSTVESAAGSAAKVTAHDGLVTAHAAATNLEKTANRGQINGYCDLNGAAKIPNARQIGDGVGSITFVIDGGGAALTVGQKGHLEIPFKCEIKQATLLADQNGSVVVNIWKSTYAAFPPVVAGKITNATPPTIAANGKSQDAVLTGWTKTIDAGNVLAFNVDSCATITRVTLALKVERV